MKRRVVVTGLGAVTPIGNTVEEFWSGIKEGKVGIGEITKFDTTEYKVKIAAEVKDFQAKDRMDFKAARRMEPFSQYAVAAAKEAFEDAGLIHAARTLGMPEYKIFWKVAVPSAGPGLVAGTILTFARALGEYGATSMLAGNIPGKTGTISQRIAMVIQDGNYLTAGIWVVIIMLVAFVLIVLMNLVIGQNTKNIRRW